MSYSLQATSPSIKEEKTLVSQQDPTSLTSTCSIFASRKVQVLLMQESVSSPTSHTVVTLTVGSPKPARCPTHCGSLVATPPHHKQRYCGEFEDCNFGSPRQQKPPHPLGHKCDANCLATPWLLPPFPTVEGVGLYIDFCITNTHGAHH